MTILKETKKEAAPAGDVQPTAQGIEIGLFAPYNESVELIADFSKWAPLKMDKRDDGRWVWRGELADGDYQYKFRVKSRSFFAEGQMKDVFDPYAASINNNDALENSILHIRGGQRVDFEFTWQHDDKPLPANQDLTIYELHVGDFLGKYVQAPDGTRYYQKGTFKDVLSKLDYLKDLGINCVELMPVKEFPGDGWGYSLRSLFAVEGTYGQPDDLCRLVDECHARGMRVVVDGVYNHAEAECPLAQIDYEYWFHKVNPDPEVMQWGPKFDYFHYDENLDVFPARKYVIESIQYWVEKFHIDGIRFDATTAIRHFDVMRELADAAFAKIGGLKPFFTVAEHVPEDPAICGRSEGAPFDAAWHDALARLLQAIITGQDRDGHHPGDLDELETMLDLKKNGYCTAGRVVNFIVNHDFNRILHILGNDAKIFDDAAFRRVRLGLGLILTAPGLPMLWMGQEFGASSEKSLEPRPLEWGLFKSERNVALHDYCRNLIHIRKGNPALRSDAFQVVLRDPERQLFGFKRWNSAGNVIVVVANLKDSHAGDFEIKEAALEDGKWHECVNGYDVMIENGVLHDSLGQSEVKVYCKQA